MNESSKMAMPVLLSLVIFGVILSNIHLVSANYSYPTTNTTSCWIGYNTKLVLSFSTVIKDGDIIAVGRTAEGDGIITDLSPKGNIKWQKIFSSDVQVEFKSVTISPKRGSIIVAGEIYANDSRNILVIKMDPTGKIEWQAEYKIGEYEVPTQVAVTQDGSIIIAGYGRDKSSNVYGILLKLGSDGQVLWAKKYGIKTDERVLSAAVYPSGKIIAVGTTNAYGKHHGIWALKLTPNGDIIWQKVYETSFSTVAYSVTTTKDGAIIGGLMGNPGEMHPLLMRINSQGKIGWEEVLNVSASDYPSVGMLPTGDILLSTPLSKFAPNGKLEWAIRFGGNSVTTMPSGIAVLSYQLGVMRIDTYNLPLNNSSNINSLKAFPVDVKTLSLTVTDTNVTPVPLQIKKKNLDLHTTNDNISLTDLWYKNCSISLGVLNVSSDPNGEVYLNTLYLGETPITITLRPGSYTLTITRDAYENHTTTVNVNANKVTKIVIQLKKKSSSASITSSMTTTSISNETTSESTKISTTSKITHSSKAGPKNSGKSICGPVLIVALAVIPLLRRHR